MAGTAKNHMDPAITVSKEVLRTRSVHFPTSHFKISGLIPQVSAQHHPPITAKVINQVYMLSGIFSCKNLRGIVPATGIFLLEFLEGMNEREPLVGEASCMA